MVYGDEAQRLPLEKIYAGQLSKHKLLIHAVVQSGERAVPDLRKHYNLLAAIEKRAPTIVAAILRHPHVGAWAAQCMRGLSKDPGSVDPDLDYLGAIAASAAILAGHVCSLTLRLRNGTLMLPMLGRALLPGTQVTVTVSGPHRAMITTGDRIIAISDPYADAPGTRQSRELRF